MHYKVAVMIAVGLYVASFLLGVGLSFLLGGSLTPGATLPSVFIIVQLGLAVFLGSIGAYLYFSFSKEPASALGGVLFAALSVAVGFVLDFLLFIPGIVAGYPITDLMRFYLEPWFWLSIGALTLSSSLTGFFIARK